MKTIGAIICVGGALTVSLYKGKKLIHGHLKIHSHHITSGPSHPHWTRGTFMLVASVLCYATWYMVQVFTYTLISILSYI